MYIHTNPGFSAAAHVNTFFQPREEMAPSFDLVDDAIEVEAHAATEDQFVDLIW